MTARLIISEHDQLGGLADDDHVQYLLINGTRAMTGDLDMGGFDINNLTRINQDYEYSSPATSTPGVEVMPDGVTKTTTPTIFYQLQWDSTVTSNVPGGVPFNNTAPAMVGSFGTCIFAQPGNLFSSSLLFNQGTQIRAQANVGPIYTMVNQPNIFADGGSYSCSQHNALRIQPRWGPNLAGGSITQTSAQLILFVATVDGTVGSSSITTLQNIVMNSPGLVAGGTIGTWEGINIANISGPSVINGIRSLMSNGTFINHTGTAPALFTAANFRFNDNVGIQFGTGQDVLLNWNGSALEFDPATGQDLRLSFGADFHTLQSANFGSGSEFRFGFDRFAFGQTGAVGNQVGVFVAPARATQVSGEWSDFLLTQAGNLTIDDTMGLVAAWTLNSISLTSGTGTLNGPVATFNIGGMTTSGLGTALTHALRVTGRSTLRGALAFESTTPAALAADANDYQGQGLGNSMREVVRVEASGADRTITGLDRQQTNDTVYIINVGTTFNVILAHQNASSAAENRIISPTGANLQLGPDEYAFLWHDDVTDRWRVLDTNGA